MVSAVPLYKTSLSNLAAVISFWLILGRFYAKTVCSLCSTFRWQRSIWTTCFVQLCPTPFTALGTECGQQATRPCWPSSTGRSWHSSHSTQAPSADTCWTHSDCGARKSTERQRQRTQTLSCFKSSFKTFHLFCWVKASLPGPVNQRVVLLVLYSACLHTCMHKHIVGILGWVVSIVGQSCFYTIVRTI